MTVHELVCTKHRAQMTVNKFPYRAQMTMDNRGQNALLTNELAQMTVHKLPRANDFAQTTMDKWTWTRDCGRMTAHK